LSGDPNNALIIFPIKLPAFCSYSIEAPHHLTFTNGLSVIIETSMQQHWFSHLDILFVAPKAIPILGLSSLTEEMGNIRRNQVKKKRNKDCTVRRGGSRKQENTENFSYTHKGEHDKERLTTISGAILIRRSRCVSAAFSGVLTMRDSEVRGTTGFLASTRCGSTTIFSTSYDSLWGSFRRVWVLFLGYFRSFSISNSEVYFSTCVSHILWCLIDGKVVYDETYRKVKAAIKYGRNSLIMSIVLDALKTRNLEIKKERKDGEILIAKRRSDKKKWKRKEKSSMMNSNGEARIRSATKALKQQKQQIVDHVVTDIRIDGVQSSGKGSDISSDQSPLVSQIEATNQSEFDEKKKRLHSEERGQPQTRKKRENFSYTQEGDHDGERLMAISGAVLVRRSRCVLTAFSDVLTMRDSEVGGTTGFLASSRCGSTTIFPMGYNSLWGSFQRVWVLFLSSNKWFMFAEIFGKWVRFEQPERTKVLRDSKQILKGILVSYLRYPIMMQSFDMEVQHAVDG
uniref:Uncharacterized protein n=1 Tax=Cucumis melo TaxID=3656 RepID=A0A9I9EI66_CUCME